MTVAAKSPFELYDGDGVTTAFAVRWRYLDVAHLLAEKIVANGTVTVLVNGTDYTATAAPTDAGGTLTLTTALAADEKLRIRRKTPLAQPTQYPTSGSFPASSHELALDRLTLQGQEAAEQLARTPQVPVGETAPELDIAAIAPGQVLALVGEKIQGVDNDPASAADSAAQALADRILAQTAKSEAENARDVTEDARDVTIDARDEALNYGSAPLFRSWAEASAATFSAGDYAMVVSADIGTHTDPVVGGTVNNAGVFKYSSSPAGLERVADLQGQEAKAEADRAEGFAESLNDRIKALPLPSGRYSTEFGTPGGARSAGITHGGLWEILLGLTIMRLAASDGTLAGGIEVKNDLGKWAICVRDKNTWGLMAGVRKDGTTYPSASAATGSLPGAAFLERLRVLGSALAYHRAFTPEGLHHIVFDEDSWGDSKNYGTVEAIQLFYAMTGVTNAGPGWIGFARAEGGTGGGRGTALNNISVTRTGTWADQFLSGTASPGSPQNFPGYDAVQSGANGSIITVDGAVILSCISLTLHCSKGSGIEQSWDGTTWAPVSVASGSGSTTASIDMGSKTRTLRLRCASGSKVAGLFGLTSNTGFVFSNLSNSGATAVQKASVQANADYQAQIASMPGDGATVIVQLGLNDTKAGTDNAVIVTAVGQVVEGYRAAFNGNPVCDVLVSCQPNTFKSVQDTLAPLLRTWADENDCAFLDLQPFFGPISESGDYSSYNRDYTSPAASTALPFLEKDSQDRHPSPKDDLIAAGYPPMLSGQARIASVFARVLTSPIWSN